MEVPRLGGQSLEGPKDKKVRRRRVGELLKVVRLGDVAKCKLKGFLGDMKHRMGIAQTF
jgi:ABC-type multidrug transport system ATPase subunit